MKILIILFNISKAQEHEWFVQQMNRRLFDMEFVLINGRNTFMEKFLIDNGIKIYHIDYIGKMSILSVTLRLLFIMLRKKYKVVHTHLFEACLTGLFAAWLLRVPRRIMTRHSSDFHHVYFPSAVKYDKLTNFLATDIIAISENVRKILINWEKVPSAKVHLIHHGITMTDYDPDSISIDRIDLIRQKYHLNTNIPVVGVISRFIEWKGLQYIIPAFKKILERFPDAVLFLANAKGPYSPQVHEMLKEIDKSSYRIVEFENDITALYRVFTVFVHTPVSETCEAFGQIYLEALASRIPSVFTLSGVASEFVENEVNCLVVPHCNAEAISTAVFRLLTDHDLVKRITRNGYQVVSSTFDNSLKISKLESLYLKP